MALGQFILTTRCRYNYWYLSGGAKFTKLFQLLKHAASGQVLDLFSRIHLLE